MFMEFLILALRPKKSGRCHNAKLSAHNLAESRSIRAHPPMLIRDDIVQKALRLCRAR